LADQPGTIHSDSPSDHAGNGATPHYEAIVVGGGPAGAIAARTLALHGRHVLLLEREQLPRYKPCGGGLSPRTVARLPFSVDTIPHVRLDRIDFRLRGNSPVSWQLPKEFPFYTVMRTDLDYMLVLAAQSAGAEVRTQEMVMAVRQKNGEFSVTTDRGDYSSPYVIGADGASSTVRRAVGVEPRSERGIAMECEVEVPERIYARYATSALFDVEAAPDGYGWVFPKPDHLSVGIGSMKPGKRQLRPVLRQFILQHQLAPVESVDSITMHAHPLPLASAGERVRWDNALLAGDAAGVADGFAGEGICYSMASGELAANVVSSALAGDTTALAGYDGTLDQLIRRDHRQASLMGNLVRRFPDAAYRILTSIGEGKSVLVPLILGEISFGDALRRLPRLLALDRSVVHQVGGVTLR
jgi:geranylgeranyl reductase family protein